MYILHKPLLYECIQHIKRTKYLKQALRNSKYSVLEIEKIIYYGESYNNEDKIRAVEYLIKQYEKRNI